jgi:CubicO group peptidase (beta-lactamase class C family)
MGAKASPLAPKASSCRSFSTGSFQGTFVRAITASGSPGARATLGAMLKKLAFRTLVVLLPAVAAPAEPVPDTVAVDKVFEAWAGTASPGCAVGVARDGHEVLQRAYGMADLEHAVANTPGTIFEAGSVSKQFTAAAIVLLAQQGRLSLDDPARRYVPELSDSAAAVTLRQMLHHVSGLRDWGWVAAAAGWPRGTRVHTQDHVLDIMSRQQALNYPPGTEYLYSNTGFNLAAIVVGRVAGEALPTLTRRSLFTPLGMDHTSWRDDFNRIVPGRAVAYAKGPDGYRQQMPFENVYGQGGLLTTVGDLLKWNENLSHPRVGGEDLPRQLESPARLLDGREIRYGLGLSLGTLRGVRELAHSGSTAGYRAFLARYPDQLLSVAVLCNAAEAPAADLAREVAALFLGDALQPRPLPAALSADEMAALAGLFRSVRSDEPLSIAVADGKLRLGESDELMPVSTSELRLSWGGRVAFAGTNAFRLQLPEGEYDEFRRVAQAAPTAAELQELVGEYVSDEAEVTYRIEVKDGALRLLLRPAQVQPLAPAYRDAFTGPGGFILFRRDEAGRVTGLSLGSGRVRDLRFRRVTPAAP